MRWADLLGNNYDLKVYRFQMRVIFIFSDSKTIKQSLRGKVSELGRERRSMKRREEEHRKTVGRREQW